MSDGSWERVSPGALTLVVIPLRGVASDLAMVGLARARA